MKRIFILSLLLLSFSIYSQNSKETELDNEVIPFKTLEDVPVFPGCKGNRKERKVCLNESMQLHLFKYFDTELAQNLGLKPGIKRIYFQFKINNKGLIEDVKVRAPHPKLKKESIRVIRLLPKMVPGKQKGVPVGVKYTLSITFNVEGKNRKKR